MIVFTRGVILFFLGINFVLPNIEANLSNLVENEAVTFWQKCRGDTDSDILTSLNKVVNEFKNCTFNLAGIQNIQEEIEVMKKTGDLDLVFGKYCIEVSKSIACYQNHFGQYISSCFRPEEMEFVNAANLTIYKSFKFLCYREGDRIALFISERGPECIQSQAESINSCLYDAFGINFWNPNVLDYVEGLSKLSSISSVADRKTRCPFLKKFSECLVNPLKKCSDVTPANMIGAFMAFLQKSLLC